MWKNQTTRNHECHNLQQFCQNYHYKILCTNISTQLINFMINENPMIWCIAQNFIVWAPVQQYLHATTILVTEIIIDNRCHTIYDDAYVIASSQILVYQAISWICVLFYPRNWKICHSDWCIPHFFYDIIDDCAIWLFSAHLLFYAPTHFPSNIFPE